MNMVERSNAAQEDLLRCSMQFDHIRPIAQRHAVPEQLTIPADTMRNAKVPHDAQQEARDEDNHSNIE